MRIVVLCISWCILSISAGKGVLILSFSLARSLIRALSLSRSLSLSVFSHRHKSTLLQNHTHTNTRAYIHTHMHGRVGLVNHLGHEICQDLEIWTATFYATKNSIPMDSDAEKFAMSILEKRKKSAPKKLWWWQCVGHVKLLITYSNELQPNKLSVHLKQDISNIAQTRCYSLSDTRLRHFLSSK